MESIEVLRLRCSHVTFPVDFRDMNMVSPAMAIRQAPFDSFVRVTGLPGTAAAARKAASRAVAAGQLTHIRRGLYYRGRSTRYGVTMPRVEMVARELLGDRGVGPAGYSAARLWGVTTQVPSAFQVATLRTVDPIDGVVQHHRTNLSRVDLNEKEIALLELLRDPAVLVEAGWGVLVERFTAAVQSGEVSHGRLRTAVSLERNLAARTNYARLSATLEETQ